MTGVATIRVWPGGAIYRAQPGDVVGRGVFAPVPVLHPKVSEAHAVISVRSALVLLPARGRLFMGDAPVEVVELRAGDTIALCRNGSARLEILDVVPPEQGVGLRLGDRPPVRLADGVSYSLVPGSDPWIKRSSPELADIWQAEGAWYLQLEGGTQPLEPDSTWLWHGEQLSAVLCEGGAAWTQRTTRTGPPANYGVVDELTLRATESGMRIDAVRADGHVVASLTGRPAEILALLLSSPGRRPWEPIARRVWGRSDTFAHLQANWHSNLRKVRRWLSKYTGLVAYKLMSYSNCEVEFQVALFESRSPASVPSDP